MITLPAKLIHKLPQLIERHSSHISHFVCLYVILETLSFFIQKMVPKSFAYAAEFNIAVSFNTSTFVCKINVCIATIKLFDRL